MTGGQFHLDGSGLGPLSDIHSQVAQGLGQLVGGGGPQTSDVARSFGNIAAGLNSALDGASQNRLSAIQTTKGSADTIKELLDKAHQMYMQGDQQGGDKLTAAAEAMEGASGAGSAGGSTGAGASGSGAGASGAGSAGGSGAEMASQMASQVGQQVGQIAQGLAQSVQGLTQGLTQLPQQIMQGIQGAGGSATKGAESAGGTAHDAAKSAEEKAGDDKDETDEKDGKNEDGKTDDKRAEERREHQANPQAHVDGAQAGPRTDGGRAPVPPAPTERPQPAQTRPQQSPL
jgi:Excreted virulence factor EspC, type VII ESX diderm